MKEISILPADVNAAKASKEKWDAIAKPLDGLGRLENAVSKIAALTGSVNVDIAKRAVAVVCSDNGVVCEGVTQTDASVTAIMAGEIARHKSSVCLMAQKAGADVFVYDVGMLTRAPGVRDMHIADGTDNIAAGPAMTREDALTAIDHGMNIVRELSSQGYRIICTGEMGIGNTTTSSAVTATLLGLPAESVTGRGAGLSDEGLARKISAIKRAQSVNKPDASDPLDVLAKLGGFDIAAMTGIFLGGAVYRVPVVIDGLISSVSALIAARLYPGARVCMLASHTSAEPAAEAILRELGVEAMIHGNFKLGEGTGAVCMLPLLDLALSVYNGSTGFSSAGIEQYTAFEGDKK